MKVNPLRLLLIAAACGAAALLLLWRAGLVEPTPGEAAHSQALYERFDALSNVDWQRLPEIESQHRAAASVAALPQRVVVLAVDGLDQRIAGTLITQGRMPNLERLIAGSAWGELAGDAGPSASGWTTAFSGRPPAEHGIAHSYPRLESQTRLEPRQLRVRRIWEIAAECGLSVGVYGLPFMRPRPATTALAVPEFALGRPTRHLPQGVSRASCGISGDPADQDFLRLKACTLNRSPHRLDVVRLRSLGGAAHAALPTFLWRRLGGETTDGRDDALTTAYVEFDRALGEIVAGLDRWTTLVICSNHGLDIAAGLKLELLIGPSVLEAFGLAQRELWDHDAAAVQLRGEVRAHAAWELLTLRPGAVDRNGHATKFKLLVQTLVFQGNGLAQGDLYNQVRQRLDHSVGPYSSLFDVVPLDYRAAVLRPTPQAAIDALAADPLGVDELRAIRPRFELGQTGSNAPGVLLLYGAGVRRGAMIQDAKLVDLASTLAALLDLPLSDELSGRVLREALDPTLIAARPLLRQATWEQVRLLRPDALLLDDSACDRVQRDPQVDRKLKLLGYLN
ncbi:MAG: alkaline phosphatase family protein [Candidatus Alcyoniella australis]|nr:alkaline phosphatase family protein [Candidatus Alcyoniella australis]